MGNRKTAMGDAPDAAAVKEAFMFFDQEGKESLDHATFVKMVQSLGQTPTQARLKELLEQYAPDDAPVDMAAVEKMMPEIAKEKKSKEDVINAFKVFDNRGNGCISVENFRQMMGSVGEKLTAPEVNEAVTKALEIAKGEEDGIDAIDYHAYVDWMMGAN